MRRQVAAVHGRDVARLQRTQVACVVPVVEMTAMLLKTPHRRDSRFQPLQGLARSYPAEVAGTNGGKQIQAEVGGGGSMRQDRSRIFLEVIRRQHLVIRRNKRLEVAPGAAGDQSQR